MQSWSWCFVAAAAVSASQRAGPDALGGSTVAHHVRCCVGAKAEQAPRPASLVCRVPHEEYHQHRYTCTGADDAGLQARTAGSYDKIIDDVTGRMQKRF